MLASKSGRRIVILESKKVGERKSNYRKLLLREELIFYTLLVWIPQYQILAPFYPFRQRLEHIDS